MPLSNNDLYVFDIEQQESLLAILSYLGQRKQAGASTFPTIPYHLFFGFDTLQAQALTEYLRRLWTGDFDGVAFMPLQGFTEAQQRALVTATIAMQEYAGLGVTYASLIASLAPVVWYKLDEPINGTVVNDSSGNGYHATAGGNRDVTNTFDPIAGYSALGRGSINKNFMNVGSQPPIIGATAGSSWTLLAWVTGVASAQGYIMNRANECAMLFGYVASTVELFNQGGIGDARTGSGIPLTAGEASAPQLIVYRYNNGAYTGHKNASQVFSYSRSFSFAGTTPRWSVGGDAYGGPIFQGKVYDSQIYDKALSDEQISAIYAARDLV